MKVENLYNGDVRIETLSKAITDLIYERGQGMAFATIVGMLDIIKHEFITDLKAEI